MGQLLRPDDGIRAAELFAETLQQKSGAIAELASLYQDALKQLAEQSISELEPTPCGRTSAVQESMIRVARQEGWCKCTTLREFEHWLAKILHDVIQDRYKYITAEKRNPDRVQPLDELSSEVFWEQDRLSVASCPGSDIDHSDEREYRSRVTREALAALPEHYQAVLNSYYENKESYEQIGKRIKRNADAVRMLIGRARNQLKKEIAKHVRRSPEQ